MTKIVLNISSKEYIVSLDDEFAKALEEDIRKLLDGKRQFSVKELLNAFVQKCHDNYKLANEMDKILGSIDKTMDKKRRA